MLERLFKEDKVVKGYDLSDYECFYLKCRFGDDWEQFKHIIAERKA